MLKYLNPAFYLRTAQRKGYTIDQTILIVVIIAILITLVIITIGWNLINRTSGAKAASQMTQLEDAVGQFYGEFRYWPHTAFATGGTALLYPLVLAGIQPTGVSLTIPTAQLKNFLPGVGKNGTSNLTNAYGGAISYSYGSADNWVGGTVTNQYVILQSQGIPLDDAKEADINIDGGTTGDFDDGRLVYSTAACLPAAGGAANNNIGTQPTTGNVFMCYVANAIN